MGSVTASTSTVAPRVAVAPTVADAVAGAAIVLTRLWRAGSGTPAAGTTGSSLVNRRRRVLPHDQRRNRARRETCGIRGGVAPATA